ncbi:hypothetical protein GCM10025778_23370 [Paeniglutamicibacter antarcticus]|uniref:Uncharacterized protein n=1 Tax=Paeniglutamicibacter antarcticus TaxID=494023 RepID=A0ABP9TLV0_9MICC
MQLAFGGNEKALKQRRCALQLFLEARHLDNINTNSHDHGFEFIGSLGATGAASRKRAQGPASQC